MALAAAAALIGLGIASAIVYRRDPLSVDDELTLWVAGSLATLIVAAIFMALLARPTPPVTDSGPRSRAALASALAGPLFGMAAVIGLIFFVIPHLVSGEFADSSTARFSGTTVLVGCLVLAAVLAFAATVATRPWRAGSFLNRLPSTVTLVAALAVAAPLTNDYGYVPLALRWGVLIIAGTFLGMAVVRLIVTGTGPVRPSAGRMPHLPAVLLVMAVIAVPWGDIGHGVQVGWWELSEYANRVDGVLPLVLVATGVVALRRLGLVRAAMKRPWAATGALGSPPGSSRSREATPLAAHRASHP